jgi:hypothetical protein
MPNFAIDRENRSYHVVFPGGNISAYCGASIAAMTIQDTQPQTLKQCKKCQWVVKRDMPREVFLNQPPTTVERLQGTEEMLMMTLFKSWANRIDREIEILKAQMVDASKLEGLSTLRDELGQASDSMSNAWMISKFGNINNP